MLTDLASGKEKSRFILLRDNIQHHGDQLFCHITQELLNRTDVVIAFIFNEQPNKFHQKFNNDPRLICYDGFSDPLNWNKQDLDEDSISSPFFLTRKLSKLLKDEAKVKQVQTSGQPCKIGIVVHSLSSLIAHQNIATVSRDVFELSQWRNNEYNVVQVVALVHEDLHEEHVLPSLNYIASTVVTLLPRSQLHEIDTLHGFYDVVHCKKSGRVQRTKEDYTVGPDFQLKIIPVDEKQSRPTESAEQEAVDVTSGLTFNVSLTEQQKVARSNLQLPYLLDEKVKKSQLDLGKKGQIFYEADKVDDLDEEDPDDDLNI